MDLVLFHRPFIIRSTTDTEIADMSKESRKTQNKGSEFHDIIEMTLFEVGRWRSG